MKNSKKMLKKGNGKDDEITSGADVECCSTEQRKRILKKSAGELRIKAMQFHQLLINGSLLENGLSKK